MIHHILQKIRSLPKRLLNSFVHYSALTLTFFNLLDYNRNLSITNLLVIGFSIKFLFFTTSFNLGDMSVLLGTFITYSYKKHLIGKKEVVNDSTTEALNEMNEKIDRVTSDVTAVKLSSGSKTLR